MRLSELQALIERFGPLATLAGVLDTLTKETPPGPPLPMGLADLDRPPGSSCTCRHRGDYLDCPIHKFPPSDA